MSLDRNPDPTPNSAAARFAIIQIVRFSGVALVLLGLAIQSGRVAALAGIPAWIGYVLIAVGLIDTFVAPAVLARRWRTPPQ